MLDAVAARLRAERENGYHQNHGLRSGSARELHGFVYKRVKADWHMLQVGRAAFFGPSKLEVFQRARRFLRHGTSQRAAV